MVIVYLRPSGFALWGLRRNCTGLAVSPNSEKLPKLGAAVQDPWVLALGFVGVQYDVGDLTSGLKALDLDGLLAYEILTHTWIVWARLGR